MARSRSSRLVLAHTLLRSGGSLRLAQGGSSGLVFAFLGGSISLAAAHPGSFSPTLLHSGGFAQARSARLGGANFRTFIGGSMSLAAVQRGSFSHYNAAYSGALLRYAQPDLGWLILHL